MGLPGQLWRLFGIGQAVGSTPKPIFTNGFVAPEAWALNPLDAKNSDGTAIDSTGGSGKFKYYISSGITILGEAAQSNTKTDSLCFVVPIKPGMNFGKLGNLTLSIQGRVAGTGTLGTKTIDATAVRIRDGAASSDLVTTAAQSLAKSSSFTTFDFVVDADNTTAPLAVGDLLLITITTSVQETGGSATLTATLGAITLTPPTT